MVNCYTTIITLVNAIGIAITTSNRCGIRTLSALRGLRNGILTGVRIRIPYIFQAVIYAAIFRDPKKMGIKGGVESLIAGFVGGYAAFGDSKGVSGSVNNQIVLYLFARALIGLIQSAVKRKIIPETLSTTTPGGFRIFAGVTLI
eukprot:gene5630-6496_t